MGSKGTREASMLKMLHLVMVPYNPILPGKSTVVGRRGATFTRDYKIKRRAYAVRSYHDTQT